MRRLSLGITLVVLSCTGARAADGEGRFAVEGVGLADCQRFVEERQKRSNLYFMFGGWLDGYLSAVNEALPETFDVTPWQSTDLLAAMIESHCADHPDDNFAGVARALARRLAQERLREASPVEEVTVGDATVPIYRATLRQAQRELKAGGHYDGALDGRYGPMTRGALEAYHRAEGLQVTGLPDQHTLIRLLGTP